MSDGYEKRIDIHNRFKQIFIFRKEIHNDLFTGS